MSICRERLRNTSNALDCYLRDSSISSARCHQF